MSTLSSGCPVVTTGRSTLELRRQCEVSKQYVDGLIVVENAPGLYGHLRLRLLAGGQAEGGECQHAEDREGADGAAHGAAPP